MRIVGAAAQAAHHVLIKVTEDVKAESVDRSALTMLGIDQLMFERYDTNRDGKLDRQELTARFKTVQKHLPGHTALSRATNPIEEARKILVLAGQPTAAEVQAERATAPQRAAAAKAAEESRLAAFLAQNARVAPTEAGVTQHIDLLVSKGPLTVTVVPNNRLEIAKAKRDALASGLDVLIVRYGDQFLRIDSLALTVGSGKLPTVGEPITLYLPRAHGKQEIEAMVEFTAYPSATIPRQHDLP